MKIHEIMYQGSGHWTHKCDCCEQETWPTLYWKERDFDLCFDCLSKLYFKYVASIESGIEKIEVIRKTISEELRNKVFERDNWKCVKCSSKEDLQVDHKTPFSRGGETELSNLQTLCKKCNLKKKSRIE